MKVKQYDEFQKLMRYKYGYYSFISLASLIILNYILGLFLDFHWGATKELEILIIVYIVALFFVNICVYHNAYFRKNDNKMILSWLCLITGLIGLYTTYQTFLIRPEEIIIDGKIGSGVIQLFSSILFLSIPVTDFIRNKIDKKIEKKECQHS